jgi:hypothetical protein
MNIATPAPGIDERMMERTSAPSFAAISWSADMAVVLSNPSILTDLLAVTLDV